MGKEEKVSIKKGVKQKKKVSIDESSGTSCCNTAFILKLLLFLCLITAGLITASSKINLTIHSCDIYIPDHLSAVVGISRSFWRFIEVEGLDSFISVFIQLIKAEILNLPPFYSADQVQGKKLLMIGGGYIPEFLKHAKILGVEIYLMDDPKMKQRTDGLVTSFIPVENFGKVSITQREEITRIIQQLGIKFDGVFTLVEDEGPLVSHLAKTLNLPGNSENASLIARNKFRVRQVMENANLNIPKYALVTKEEDLEPGALKIGFPVFLKPVYGVAASFAAKATSLNQLKQLYREFQKEMDPQIRSIYNYGQEMILEEQLDGPEIQLEMMVHQGEIIFHCFSSQYAFNREWLVFPVNLTSTQKEELLELAKQTVRAIGITNGVVHVEMFYSSKGPQLIEVNNRLSRGFLPRRFSHQLMFGERLTDYFASVIYLALGLEPPKLERQMSPISLAILLDQPSINGWETEGGCAIFFGPTPQYALEEAISYGGSL